MYISLETICGSEFNGFGSHFESSSVQAQIIALSRIVVVKRSLRCDVKGIDVIREVLIHIFIFPWVLITVMYARYIYFYWWSLWLVSVI